MQTCVTPRLWHGCCGDVGGNDIIPAPISGLACSLSVLLSLLLSLSSLSLSSLLSEVSLCLRRCLSRRLVVALDVRSLQFRQGKAIPDWEQCIAAGTAPAMGRPTHLCYCLDACYVAWRWGAGGGLSNPHHGGGGRADQLGGYTLRVPVSWSYV